MSAKKSENMQQSPEDDKNVKVNSNNKKKRAGPQMVVTGTPRDVLCGRGFHILNHHGNLRLHILVNKYRKMYFNSRRKDKPHIIRKILQEVKETGARFMKRVNGDNSWVEVDDECAYEKVSHALRLQKKNGSDKILMSNVDRNSAGQDDVANRQQQGEISIPAEQGPTQRSTIPTRFVSGSNLQHYGGAVATSSSSTIPPQPQPSPPLPPVVPPTAGARLVAIPIPMVPAAANGIHAPPLLTVGDVILYDHLHRQIMLSALSQSAPGLQGNLHDTTHGTSASERAISSSLDADGFHRPTFPNIEKP